LAACENVWGTTCCWLLLQRPASGPEYIFAYPNGDQVQLVTTFFECRVVGGELVPDMHEIVGARYFGPGDELPSMRPCCVAKAHDAFAFDGRAYFR
jgi:hypothetical protein